MIAEIRDALADRMAIITDLRAHHVWPDVINPPAVLVSPSTDVAFLEPETFLGGWVSRWDLRIVVPVQAGIARAQERLNDLIDPHGMETTSVVVALETDGLLDTGVSGVTVTGVDRYTSVEIAGIEYLSAVCRTEVRF